MQREAEALSPSSFIEKGLLLAFLLSACWAGFRFGTRLQAHDPRELSQGYASRIGSEWTQARLFPGIAPIESWVETQASLTRRTQTALARGLAFNYVTKNYPVETVELSSFDDYGIKPVFPLPGSVFKTRAGGCIDFAWTEIPVKGTRYTLEVAKTPGFTFYRSFGSETNSLRLRANKQADYFWRVRAAVRRNAKVSVPSTFLVVEPPMTSEEKRLKEMAARVKDPNAWLADLQFCR